MRTWIGCALALCASGAAAQADGGTAETGAADAGPADTGSADAGRPKANDAPFPELPQSPAFEALGTTPSGVLRPSSVREVGVDLAGAIDSSGTLKPGFSLETAPIWLAIGGSTTLKEWQESLAQRLASWISVSLATLGADDGGTSTSEGLRVVLHDGSDPRFDPNLTACLDKELKDSVTPPPTPAPQPTAAPPLHKTPSPTEAGKLLSAFNDAMTRCRKISLKEMSTKVTFSAALAGAITQHIKKGDTLPDDWARKLDAWASVALNGFKVTDGVGFSTTGTVKFESDTSTSSKSVSAALRLRLGDQAKALSVDASWKPIYDSARWHDRMFTLSGRFSWPIYEKVWIEASGGTYLGADRQGQKPFGSLQFKFNRGSD